MNRVLNFLVRYTLTAGSLAFVFTIGIAFNRCRELIWVISRRLKIPEFTGEREKPPELLLRRMDVDELIPVSKYPVAFPSARDGNITTLELLIINTFVQTCNPGKIFEIGTFNGRTTLNLALNSRPDAEIYTLDLPSGQIDTTAYSLDVSEKPFVCKEESGSIYKNSTLGQKYKIHQLYGDSGSFDFGPYLNSMNFVFVDGSHQYEYAKNDSDIALKLLENGKGVIVWHDYNPGWPGVAIALNELYKKEPFNAMLHIDNTSLVYLSL
jgi:hypothetical protein